MALIALPDAEAQLNITSVTDEPELQGYVDAAIGVVERYTRQSTTSQSYTETMHPESPSVLLVRHRPLTAVTVLQTADGVTQWDVSTVEVEADGIVTVTSGPPLSGRLHIEYTAGWVDPPSTYRLAALVIVQHLWQTQRGSARPGPAPGPMSESMGQTVGGGRGYAIPNAALELLGEPAPVVV